jgi:hypothetical protein
MLLATYHNGRKTEHLRSLDEHLFDLATVTRQQQEMYDKYGEAQVVKDAKGNDDTLWRLDWAKYIFPSTAYHFRAVDGVVQAIKSS